jgi:hypothetical protein
MKFNFNVQFLAEGSCVFRKRCQVIRDWFPRSVFELRYAVCRKTVRSELHNRLGYVPVNLI